MLPFGKQLELQREHASESQPGRNGIVQRTEQSRVNHGHGNPKPIILKSTIPDFCWMNKRKIVYLDGIPVHSSDKQQDNETAKSTSCWKLKDGKFCEYPISRP